MLDNAQLEVFLDYITLAPCEPSQTICKEKQPGDSMFLILEGQCRVYSKQKNGEIVFLRLLDAGEAFGEIAMLNQTARSAGVEATKSCLLLKLSADALARLVVEEPALAAQFLYHLSRSLGHQLSELTARFRLGRELKEVAQFIR